MTRMFLTAATSFLLLAGLLLAGTPADAKEKQNTLLLVIGAEGAEVADATLTLKSVDRYMVAFTDRPARRAGRISAEKLTRIWSEGHDSLAGDPPNAVLVGNTSGDEQEQLAVELSNPRWQDGNLVFDIAALEGALPPTASYDHASLFVDDINTDIDTGISSDSPTFFHWDDHF